MINKTAKILHLLEEQLMPAETKVDLLLVHINVTAKMRDPRAAKRPNDNITINGMLQRITRMSRESPKIGQVHLAVLALWGVPMVFQ